LGELTTVSKSGEGAQVEQNFVQTALDHLTELYTKVNDPVEVKNAEELLRKAEAQGLTKVEVNNLARQYGSEFKSKAFNAKSGDALTSVNAQAYENVRRGLKDVARRGMSAKAKEIDETMSHIYNTKRLIDQNVEKINELRQKTDPRGLGAKIGGGALNIIDTLTMGTVKGAFKKMFPRNMGLKTKNWLDAEESLARNLKIIDKALNAKTAGELRATAWEARKALPKGAERPLGLPPGKYPPLEETPGSTPWRPPVIPMRGDTSGIIPPGSSLARRNFLTPPGASPYLEDANRIVARAESFYGQNTLPAAQPRNALVATGRPGVGALPPESPWPVTRQRLSVQERRLVGGQASRAPELSAKEMARILQGKGYTTKAIRRQLRGRFSDQAVDEAMSK
jgi:hypothetical protein